VMRADLAFPFAVDAARGSTASAATYDEHVRDLIVQALFTNPGERVNRPDFGAGLMRAVFMPEGDQAMGLLGTVVQANLQQWLADVISVEGVEVEPDGSVLNVIVRYRILATGDRRVGRFSP
jgi:phage baseplate assembly protein W